MSWKGKTSATIAAASGRQACSGRFFRTSASILSYSGQFFARSAQLESYSGQILSKSGHLFGSSAQFFVCSGQLKSKSGQFLSSSGRVFGNSGPLEPNSWGSGGWKRCFFRAARGADWVLCNFSCFFLLLHSKIASGSKANDNCSTFASRTAIVCALKP